MKRLAAGFVLAAICTLSAADEKSEVTKLDGTKLFGKVEVVDNYTIRISSDTGILRIPIALLGGADFKKYSGSQDRSQDGRLWSERKDALESEKTKESAEPAKDSAQGDVIEIQLQELIPFQPVIASYQEQLSLEKAKDAGSEKDTAKTENNAGSTAPTMNLFSDGGLGNPSGALGNLPGAGAASSAASSALNAAPVPAAPVPLP